MLAQVRERQKQLLEQGADFPDGIIVCMSGSVVQRGELALLDKWQRGAAAVANGADLVLELPTAFACRSAANFATGGVKLLHATGIVDMLAFGTAYPDVALLQRAASFPADDYPNELQAYLKQGLSYGAALSALMEKKLSLPDGMLQEPNTILGLEYLRAIRNLSAHGQRPAATTASPTVKTSLDNPTSPAVNASTYNPVFPAVTASTDSQSSAADNSSTSHLNMPYSMQPLTILRHGTQHSDLSAKGQFASGTAIREMVLAGNAESIATFVPPATFQSLTESTAFPAEAKLLTLLTWQLSQLSVTEISAIYGVNEGLEYRLKAAIPAATLTELVQSCATRRYPATRIQRLLLLLLLKVTHEAMSAFDAAGPQYIRVLAFNDRGRALLKKIRQKSALPVITKVTEFLNRRDMQQPEQFSLLQQMLALDIAATNLRELCLSPCPARNTIGGLQPTGSSSGTNFPASTPRLNLDFFQSPVYVRN